MEIHLSNYGKTKSSRTARSHSLVVQLGKDLEVFFSYETPIAFAVNGCMVIRENDFSRTTGVHLNWVDPNKDKRVKGEVFEELLDKAVLAYRKGVKGVPKST